MQDPLHRARADGVHDAIGDCLASQVLGRPVGDVQPLGDRLQTGQFDDLGSLQGGKSPAGAPAGSRPAGVASTLPARSGGRPARRWPGHIRPGTRRPESVRRQRRPRRCERVGPGTRPSVGGERPLAGWEDPQQQQSQGEVCVHAWGHLWRQSRGYPQHTRLPGICCMTSVRVH